MKRTVAGALLVGLIALTGCTAALHGRVLSATTGQPIEGATVTVSKVATTTDATGGFALAGLGRSSASGVVKVDGYPPIAFTADISKGDGVAIVKVADANLAVSVKDHALEPKAISSLRVSLDGRESTSTPATFGPLPPGPHRLKVEAKDHESQEITVTLAPGANTKSTLLNLTPLETYRRFFAAGQFKRKAEYAYVHPDDAKLVSRKAWNAKSSGIAYTSIDFGDVRSLKSWKSAFTGKSYDHVSEIDRTIRYQVTDPKFSDYGQTFTDNLSQHWVQLKGLWYIVHATKY